MQRLQHFESQLNLPTSFCQHKILPLGDRQRAMRNLRKALM